MFGKLSGGVGLAALLLLGACATPGQPDVSPRAAGPTPAMVIAGLPSQVGGYRRRNEITDFERNPATSGLGASIKYDPVSGEPVSVTVYVYDRGALRRPDGGESADVDKELQYSATELRTLVQRGIYASVQADVGLTVKDRSGAAKAKCATFRISQTAGVKTGDAVCVAIRDGRFLKVRLTEGITGEPAGAGMLASTVMSELFEAISGPARLTAGPTI